MPLLGGRPRVNKSYFFGAPLTSGVGPSLLDLCRFDANAATSLKDLLAMRGAVGVHKEQV